MPGFFIKFDLCEFTFTLLLLSLLVLLVKKNHKSKSAGKLPVQENFNILTGTWELTSYKTYYMYYPGGAGAPEWLYEYNSTKMIDSNHLLSWSKYWIQDKDTPTKHIKIIKTNVYTFHSKIEVSVIKDSVMKIHEVYITDYAPTPDTTVHFAEFVVHRNEHGTITAKFRDWILFDDSTLVFRQNSPDPQGGQSQTINDLNKSFHRRK